MVLNIDGERYVRMGAAARALGVTSTTVRRWCSTGQLAFLQRDSGHRLISVASIDDLRRRTLQVRPGKATGKPRPTDNRGRTMGVVVGSSGIAYACVEVVSTRRKYRTVTSGCVSPASTMRFPDRLQVVHRTCAKLFQRYKPDRIALLIADVPPDRLLVTGHIRGVTLLAAIDAGVTIIDYEESDIRRAIEEQRTSPKLSISPSPSNPSDALAVAASELLQPKSKSSRWVHARENGRTAVLERRL